MTSAFHKVVQQQY